MRRMDEYKKKYNMRRKNEKSNWRKKHNAEIKIIQDKNKLLDTLWARDTSIVNTSNNLQAFQIASSFSKTKKADLSNMSKTHQFLNVFALLQKSYKKVSAEGIFSHTL